MFDARQDDLQNVVVTLTVRYSARGDLVRMNNLVAMGSFEPPFDPQDSYYDADWIFTNTAVWTVDRTAGKFGLNALKWVGVRLLRLKDYVRGLSKGLCHRVLQLSD